MGDLYDNPGGKSFSSQFPPNMAVRLWVGDISRSHMALWTFGDVGDQGMDISTPYGSGTPELRVRFSGKAYSGNSSSPCGKEEALALFSRILAEWREELIRWPSGQPYEEKKRENNR